MASQEEQWKTISERARRKLADSIPSEWRIPQEQLPADDVLDVTEFPAKSGLLEAKELEITESLATEIVSRIAKGEWRAVEVARAFCKRAAIAHQLVRDPFAAYQRRVLM
jgi:amidase